MSEQIVSVMRNSKLAAMLLPVKTAAEMSLIAVDRYCVKYKPWQIILITAVGTYVVVSLKNFHNDLEEDLGSYLKKKLFNMVKKLPFVSRKLKEEIEKARVMFEEEITKANKGNLYLQSLPRDGMSNQELLNLIDNSYLKMNNQPWKDGLVSGCVYGTDENLVELVSKVSAKFAWSNPMHFDIFPDVRKMEAEVVRIVCRLFNGDDLSCGCMTSGGTESIMLACRAYRDRAYEMGIKRPEMIIPVTAHAAFKKAGQYFKIKVHTVPVNPITKRVEAQRVKSYINSNTCMIVGSAPQYPHGAIDPIEDLSKLAVKYKVPLHVDACLGGFLIIFMKEAGYNVPPFDFRLPGVTSISCDTHKYGYTPKGTSVIMYRDVDYRKFQFYTSAEWPGGIYTSPTFAGSRSGNAIAMTWAVLMSIGHDNYVQITKSILDTTRFISNEIRKIKELKLMCEPDVSVVAFDSNEFNILRLFDEFSEKGWHLNALQYPPGVHFTVTRIHTLPGVAERFIDDLKASVKNLMSKDDRHLGKLAALYSSVQSVPDKRIITEMTNLLLDACYTTDNKLMKKANGFK